MPDDITTEPAPAPASGVPDASVLQAQLVDVEAKRRSFQAENDLLKKQLADAKAAAAAPPAPEPPPAPAAATFDPAAAADQFYAALSQKQAVADAQRAAKEKFPLADASVLAGKFETPEEVERAAQTSHEQATKLRETLRAEADAALRAELKAKGIDLPAPQVTPNAGADAGAPLTVQDIAALPFSEMKKLDPEAIEAALGR